MPGRDAQPEIIIFAYGQGLVESASRVEQSARHHNRRRADQAKIEAAAKDVPRRFLMLESWIGPQPATDPNLIGLTNLNFRMLVHECGLHFELFRKPEIVGIEKREIAPARDAYSMVARRRYAPLFLLQQPQMRTEPGKSLLRFVGGTVIHDNELKVPVTLAQDRSDCLA